MLRLNSEPPPDRIIALVPMPVMIVRRERIGKLRHDAKSTDLASV
jgi:hypothetical protein